jgi:cytochrome c oxidase cbb3-type subunit 3
MTPTQKATDKLEQDELRPHSYDGIQEFDKRLPNWWLFTLYGSIIFSFAYWIFYHTAHLGLESTVGVELQMLRNKARAAAGASVVNDENLWRMSRDEKVVADGKATFLANCASCHLPTLTGQIGPNLADEYWLHGGTPLEVIHTITQGEITKGMPTWGPVLGNQKITEVTAFIFSHHKQGEPVKQAPPWIPGQVMQTPTAAAN